MMKNASQLLIFDAVVIIIYNNYIIIIINIIEIIEG